MQVCSLNVFFFNFIGKKKKKGNYGLVSGGFGEKSVFLNFIHSGRLDTWGQRFGKGMWREIQRIKEGKMRAAGDARGR